MIIYEFLHTLKQAHEPSFKYKKFYYYQTNDQTLECAIFYFREMFSSS